VPAPDFSGARVPRYERPPALGAVARPLRRRACDLGLAARLPGAPVGAKALPPSRRRHEGLATAGARDARLRRALRARRAAHDRGVFHRRAAASVRAMQRTAATARKTAKLGRAPGANDNKTQLFPHFWASPEQFHGPSAVKSKGGRVNFISMRTQAGNGWRG
jgi:hypothetical protein